MGEQSGELFYNSIGKIEKRTVGTNKKSKQMKSTMEAHRLQCASALRSLIPVTKKRKTFDE